MIHVHTRTHTHTLYFCPRCLWNVIERGVSPILLRNINATCIINHILRPPWTELVPANRHPYVTDGGGSSIWNNAFSFIRLLHQSSCTSRLLLNLYLLLKRIVDAVTRLRMLSNSPVVSHQCNPDQFYRAAGFLARTRTCSTLPACQHTDDIALLLLLLLLSPQKRPLEENCAENEAIENSLCCSDGEKDRGKKRVPAAFCSTLTESLCTHVLRDWINKS